jgi:hypothetical protein
MSLQPINQEQVQKTTQILLAFLSDEKVSIPGSMLEGIFSAKSLLNGILSGNLLVCQNAADKKPDAPAPPVEVDEVDVEAA